MRRFSSGRFRLIHIFLSMLVLAAFPASAGVPVGQVFHVEGTIRVQTDNGPTPQPAARGRLLSATDRLELAPGALLGIYFREGGRRLLRAGDVAIKGRVADFVPTLEPYRGEAVYFGATRGVETDTASETEAAEPSARIFSYPGGELILGHAPGVTFEIRGDTTAIEAAQLVLFAEETEALRLEARLAITGRVLRLAPPTLLQGGAYALEIRLLPTADARAAGAEVFTHRIPFYLVIETGDTAVGDFLSNRFLSMGTFHPRLGAEHARVDYEMELGGGVEPVLSFVLKFP